MKGPNRFEREEEVKVLLEEAEALGITEKAGPRSKQVGRGGLGSRSGL